MCLIVISAALSFHCGNLGAAEILSFESEVGGVFSRETAPEPGNRFRLRLRLRCVRAKLRVRDVSAVAGCGLVEKPGRPPPPSHPGPCRRRKTTPLFYVG